MSADPYFMHIFTYILKLISISDGEYLCYFIWLCSAVLYNDITFITLSLVIDGNAVIKVQIDGVRMQQGCLRLRCIH